MKSTLTRYMAKDIVEKVLDDPQLNETDHLSTEARGLIAAGVHTRPDRS